MWRSCHLSPHRRRSTLNGMTSNLTPLLERNRAFAAEDTRKNTPRLPFLPHQGLYVITCIDPRTDPAQFLGLRFAEAIVARTVGGRVTPAVIQDLAYIGYLVETKAPEGPYFEAAIIHHTDCGSGLLADDDCATDSRSAAATTRTPSPSSRCSTQPRRSAPMSTACLRPADLTRASPSPVTSTTSTPG